MRKLLCIGLVIILSSVNNVSARPIEDVTDPGGGGGGGTPSDIGGTYSEKFPIQLDETYNGRFEDRYDYDYFEIEMESFACLEVQMTFLSTDYEVDMKDITLVHCFTKKQCPLLIYIQRKCFLSQMNHSISR